MYVFGVGLNKTGTTSLSDACGLLGFRSFHHEGLNLAPSEVQARLDRAIAEHRHPFRYVARMRLCNALFDLRPVQRHFEYFDRYFPGSKFILHTRDRDAWLASRQKHVEYNQRVGAKMWLTVDREGWIELWDSHHRAVRDYFADRPHDLLTIDVAGGDGWAPLCGFLGRPVPARAFPFSNRAKM